jgi:hypothetical protein
MVHMEEIQEDIITFRFSSKTFKFRNIDEQMDNIPCE